MNLRTILATIVLFTTISACNEASIKTENTKSDIIGSTKVYDVKINTSTEGYTKIADTVTYMAVIKNPNPIEDDYMNDWLKGTHNEAFAAIIMNALLSGKLKGYNYLTGKEMSIDDIKEFEANYARERIGKVLFTEDWYFNEKDLTMHKVVNSVMFGYENYDPEGNVSGYKSGIRVYFNNFTPMKGAAE